jgi:UDP-N-acetylmuramoylalanine--D-glutamate ligase
MSQPADLDLASPAIIGFGLAGRALAGALLQRGHLPVVVEDRPGDDHRAEAAKIGVELVEAPSEAELEAILAKATVLLPSPGVPDHHPGFELAARLGVVVRSELDLARLWDQRPLVAITGTNGKTTVTTVVTDALNRGGRPAAAVGNTDVPLVTAIDDPTIEVFVVEASSFRLGHSHRFSPVVAAWLNFAPDHLDAHRSLGAYERAKASIWANLGPEAVVVANADDAVVMRHVPLRQAVQLFSVRDPGADWHIASGRLTGPSGPLVAVDELARSQPHDLANALAAAAVSVAAGAGEEAAAAAISAFTGLPHRLELIGRWGGVAWYDDSKATVPQATLAAVGGFESVVLIAGGRNKGLALGDLRLTVPPVRHVVTIGEAAGEVAAAFDGAVPVSAAGGMDEAVGEAQRAARPGDAVLLSPGCTSYDWYRNYEERGRDFANLVRTTMRRP